MNVHEYQAKAIFRKFGLNVPTGKVFNQKSLSLNEISAMGRAPFVVKAQVHAGGRGKAGGIKIVETAEAAFETAKEMLGKTLATYQTAGSAKPIDSVLIEEARHIQKELYVAVTLDREKALPCIICSDAGGVEIETVAHEAPEKVLKFHFETDAQLIPALFEPMAAQFAKTSKEISSLKPQIADLLARIAQIFVELDATLVEINPLGLMSDGRLPETRSVSVLPVLKSTGFEGRLSPVDAKINFDDNSLFRHPEIAALQDPRQEDPRETEAKKYELSYVGLGGNIGCMVNGAGLAMATMDIIKLTGGEPANFLDVGGGASKEKVAAAFQIILRDPSVKAILVNIFGGIMRCDVIAEGILAAVRESDLKVPLVVRLEGTNVKEGKAILAGSKLPLIAADSFTDAARKVVASSELR